MKSKEIEKESGNYLNFPGMKKGIKGWIFSTDHKRIGILYLVSLLFFFNVGLFLGISMRLELIAPGKTVMEASTYNSFFTIHGVIMIFLFIIPGIPATFGNFLLPIILGAKDVAFPRLNLLSFWFYIIGAILVVFSLFFGGGPVDTGWTFYVPYSTKTPTNVIMSLTAVFILGFSSILTGLNFVTTIHLMRAPGMTWFRMPLFSWSLYATGWTQILATPIVGITLLLVIFERLFGVGFFDPSKGGDPLLFQHLFWVYSHPAVYIMILPAMGVVSEIIPTFSARTIFGYKAIAISSMSIAIVGYLVWGHHMFTSGISDFARMMFSLFTYLVAVPTGIKIFNWVATLYRGSIDLKTPMIYALSFIFLFCIAGFTGLMNGALALNIHIHDTSFIVAHFHYAMFGGAGFVFFGALHYWYPKITGRMYNEKHAIRAFFIQFVGFNLLYFPLFVIGYQGMPRRYYDYVSKFTTGHLISTVGSWILALGILYMLVNLFRSLFRGQRAMENPWGGTTLEWKISSPPLLENFHEIPKITCGPYNFQEGKVIHG